LFYQVRNLTPQVAHAARVLLNNPNNPNAQEHFEEMKKQWSDRADTLTNLVDQGTDRLKFLEASGLSYSYNLLIQHSVVQF
jgi:vinculin